jgi:hypothetical protein
MGASNRNGEIWCLARIRIRVEFFLRGMVFRMPRSLLFRSDLIWRQDSFIDESSLHADAGASASSTRYRHPNVESIA